MPPAEPVRFFTYEYRPPDGGNLLPGDDGGWSLEGVAHAATITMNYFIEGRVRRRAPYNDFKIFIAPPHAGSWAADFLVQMQSPGTWAGVVAGLSVNIPYVFRVFGRLAKRATGVQAADDGSERFEAAHQGTFDALVEAVEPSLIRAHRVIEAENTTLSIISGSSSIVFNKETRRYIESSILDSSPLRWLGNVASYNVNGRTGRIYFSQMGRTVPFRISRDADAHTEVAIARSLENYASYRLSNDNIRVRFLATRAEDTTIKNILILDAAFMFEVRDE